jgi:hypothetical protein
MTTNLYNNLSFSSNIFLPMTSEPRIPIYISLYTTYCVVQADFNLLPSIMIKGIMQYKIDFEEILSSENGTNMFTVPKQIFHIFNE